MSTPAVSEGSAAGGAAGRAAGVPRVDCHGLTHPGRVRAENEDQFAVLALQHGARLLHGSLGDAALVERLTRVSGQVLIVADGVGGIAGGREASRLAVATVAEYLAEVAACYRGMDAGREHDFLDRLTTGVERAHRRLIAEFGEGRGPATTLTLVALLWPRAYIVHVGDSRGYVLRRGRLLQFTKDQTMGALFVDIGRVTEEQAERRGLNDVLSSAVGGDLAPVVGVLDVAPGEALLLCTDGLTKHVSDARIAERIAAAPHAEAACRALVEDALEGGGTDNVTVVVARFVPAG